MFSSNQIFEISGELNDLEETLKFALNFKESSTDEISYQITEDGKYCLGWTYDKEDFNHSPINWHRYPFDFDVHIISEIIKQHIRKLSRETKSEYGDCDGSVGEGFLMKVIPETFADEKNGIKNPFYGIVSIEPFDCFYSK